MTSRSQNPELYRIADHYLNSYRNILDRHGINYDTRARIGRNASSWTLRRFGRPCGLLLLACSRVHSELVGRATGIWQKMLQEAIRDARALDISCTRSKTHLALATDLAEWLKGLESSVAELTE